MEKVNEAALEPARRVKEDIMAKRFSRKHLADKHRIEISFLLTIILFTLACLAIWALGS